jgi:hypothetical protein
LLEYLLLETPQITFIVKLLLLQVQVVWQLLMPKGIWQL